MLGPIGPSSIFQIGSNSKNNFLLCGSSKDFRFSRTSCFVDAKNQVKLKYCMVDYIFQRALSRFLVHSSGLLPVAFGVLKYSEMTASAHEHDPLPHLHGHRDLISLN